MPALDPRLLAEALAKFTPEARERLFRSDDLLDAFMYGQSFFRSGERVPYEEVFRRHGRNSSFDPLTGNITEADGTITLSKTQYRWLR